MHIDAGRFLLPLRKLVLEMQPDKYPLKDELIAEIKGTCDKGGGPFVGLHYIDMGNCQHIMPCWFIGPPAQALLDASVGTHLAAGRFRLPADYMILETDVDQFTLIDNPGRETIKQSGETFVGVHICGTGCDHLVPLYFTGKEAEALIAAAKGP